MALRRQRRRRDRRAKDDRSRDSKDRSTPMKVANTEYFDTAKDYMQMVFHLSGKEKNRDNVIMRI